MFAPHTFATSVTGCPRVVLTHDAYNDMAILVQEVGTEVGWLGTVRRDGQTFIIERIFLVDQQAGAATTEISPAGVEKLTMDLLGMENGVELVNAMRFWGHSHVNMGTGPSAQDNDQMKLFQENGCEWFVRGIFNKAKRAQFDIYYFHLGFAFFDVEWSLQDAEGNARRTFWKEEIKEKVKPLYPANTGYTPNYGGGGGGLPPYDRPPYHGCNKKTRADIARDVREDPAIPFLQEEAAIKARWDAYMAECDRQEEIRELGLVD